MVKLIPHLVVSCANLSYLCSVWRPIGDPVESMPLAFMDGSRVPQDKLVEVDVVRQSFPGESYYPLEHDGYKWHFLNRQEQDEVIFMKMSDTKTDVAAKCMLYLILIQIVTDDCYASSRLPPCLIYSEFDP